MEADKRFFRRIAASKLTNIEFEGKTYEVDTINVSHSGMLIDTDAPLEVGSRIIWGDEKIGRVHGTVTRITSDGYGVIFRPGQSTTPHVLKEVTEGLLSAEGDPEGRGTKKKTEAKKPPKGRTKKKK